MSQNTADSSAPAGTVRLTAAQAIVRFLSVQHSERDGVRRRLIPAMLGIFGHGNVCGLGQALDEPGHDLRFLQPKNEQAMVHTAIGYAKTQRGLATLACTASIGPGALNMVTGAATATVNRVPVLLFPADTFASRLQGPPMQALGTPGAGDLTVNDCFRPVSRFFDRVCRPEQLLAILPAAMRALVDPEMGGAITISLHQDLQAEAYDFPEAFFEPRTWHVARRPPAQEEIERAVALLAYARKPLIIAGGGVRYAEAEQALKDLSDAYGIPVAETSAGKGVAAHANLGTGAVGHSGTRASNSLAREADVVLCVGSRLIDLTTGSNSLFENPEVRFIGINVCASDADRLGALPILADAREALQACNDALGNTGWHAPEEWGAHARAELARWQQAIDAHLGEEHELSQGAALRTLNEQAQADDVLVVAAGTPHVDVHKLWDTSRASEVLMEVGFSCMGHDIPAAVGVRMGAPQAGEVYALIGDGNYLMAHTELVTAVQEGLKITLILVDNHGFQSIHALQRAKTGRSFGLEFRAREQDGLTGQFVAIDFAANAASYGCATYEARTSEELAAALAAARAQQRTSVIVVHVDPLRLTLSSECWWDVGVAEVSAYEETRVARAASEAGRANQRWLA
ncbi:MAG TPA: 3D-(3,5/4)-trihydroxycyclohexane-1,2-dione acylhydrolase (decyclizing) [Solirubrobacteraceae bacterium]|jgi:3D-(3,5/4)-trihydroxycyclohexane-1,2-dione acylhydrolase (decyclizing)|nr:3D-(3,5/4)-trihydroxycyclohexane-1,2-dione acylhydrolase (decyclizing) [Solirubrobacteraceae bacterium]